VKKIRNFDKTSLMMKKCLFLLFLSASIFAAPQDQNAKDLGPWFTGPLLAPSASCNSFRELTWQPYLFFTNTFGSFDNNWNRKNAPNLYTVRALVDITYGISSFMDIEATPSFVYQTSQGSSSVRMSDTPIFLGIQVLR